MGLKESLAQRRGKHQEDRQQRLAEQEIKEREAIDNEGSNYFVRKFYGSISKNDKSDNDSILITVLKIGTEAYRDSFPSIYERITDYSKKYNLEIIAVGSSTIVDDTNECVEVIFKKKQDTFPTL